MADRVTETMDGTLGHFWLDFEDIYNVEKSLDGYVRFADDNSFDISTLRTLEASRDFGGSAAGLPQPDAVYGMTGISQSVFFDRKRVSQNNVIGGLRASTQTIRMRGIVVNAPLDIVEDTRFIGVEVWIPEVTRWSDLQGVSEHVERYEDSLPKVYTASTVEVEALEIEIRRGLKLTLDTTWSVEGPADRRTLSTPLVVGTSSNTPRSWHQHLVPLMAVQDLISLAYEGFVLAEHGTVEFKCKEEEGARQRPGMWNSRLMTIPHGVSRPDEMTKFPLFHLRHIGGVKGLRNWIRLTHKFPRATGPVANKYRYGTSGVEVRLLEIALGLEYWTKVHNELGRAWAQPRRLTRRQYEPLPMSVGRHVGPAFADFVGDLAKWSDLFWNTYNHLKHVPSFDYSPNDVRILGDTGALLLLGELLNRVAGNKRPMEMLCRNLRTEDLKQNVRELVNR
jgi:hypothetical protein